MEKTNQIDTQELQKCAIMLKAIAHPLRIAIIELLEEHGSLSVTEIYQHLQIEQAVASHHLGILKNKDVLESYRDGKNMLYTLKHPHISRVIDCIQNCCNT